jgi:hypothetical protein
MGCGSVGPHVITVTGNVVGGSEESPGIERAEITLDISAVTLPKAKERLGEYHPVLVLYEETLGALADLVEEAKELRELVKEASKEWTKSVEFSDWPEAQDWVLRAEAATQAEQGE